MIKGRVKSISGLNIRAKPNGEKVGILPHNAEVNIIEEVTFYRVKSPTGQLGYVHGDFLEKLPEMQAASGQALSLETKGQFIQSVFQSPQFIGESVKVDHDFIPALERVADFAEQCELKVWVTSSTRSLNNQVAGAIVTPASRSCHHIGHAIDMNLMFEGKLYNSKKLKRENLDNLPSAIPKFINLIRDDEELRWGGDFNTEDPVHIDDDYYRKNELFYMAKLHDRVAQSNV